VAHELGHYALHHILIGCGIGVLFIIWSIPVNLFFTPLFFKYLPEKWKIKKVQDLAAITMFVYISHCTGFFMEPFGNFYTRGIEKDADMYGLKLHHDPINFARTYAFLSNENLSDPCPPKLLEIWLFSHPPLATRIKYVTEPDVKN
jgi:Zn-dependent protease with chaperone function